MGTNEKQNFANRGLYCFRKIEKASHPPVVLAVEKRTQVAYLSKEFGQSRMHSRIKIYIDVLYYRRPSFHVHSGLADNEPQFY